MKKLLLLTILLLNLAMPAQAEEKSFRLINATAEQIMYIAVAPTGSEDWIWLLDFDYDADMMEPGETWTFWFERANHKLWDMYIVTVETEWTWDKLDMTAFSLFSYEPEGMLYWN